MTKKECIEELLNRSLKIRSEIDNLIGFSYECMDEDDMFMISADLARAKNTLLDFENTLIIRSVITKT